VSLRTFNDGAICQSVDGETTGILLADTDTGQLIIVNGMAVNINPLVVVLTEKSNLPRNWISALSLLITRTFRVTTNRAQSRDRVVLSHGQVGGSSPPPHQKWNSPPLEPEGCSLAWPGRNTRCWVSRPSAVLCQDQYRQKIVGKQALTLENAATWGETAGTPTGEP